MNKEDKQDIKKRILEELEKTEELILDYKESTKPISQKMPLVGFQEWTRLTIKVLLKPLFEKQRKKFNKLKLVLDKINDADFGLCMRCQTDTNRENITYASKVEIV